MILETILALAVNGSMLRVDPGAEGACMTGSEEPGAGQGGLAGGGPIRSHAHGDQCISAFDRARASAALDWFYSWHGPVEGAHTEATNLYDFFPQGGNQYRDLFMNNFVDMNPAGGAILDWDCTDVTYDGHWGHDCGLKSFGEQQIGVPIFAIKPGTVAARDDGHFDMNTNPQPSDPANYVIVDHGGGNRTLYWHMKNGSVAVNVGQQVRAGQQLGLTASSGYSTGPHLHFEVWRTGNALVEPYTGACNPGASGWANQTPIDRAFRPFDFSFSRTPMNTVPGPPYALPTGDQYAMSDPLNWFWMEAYNLPAFSTWRVRYNRPNGTLAFDSGTAAFNNSASYRWSWWYWNWNITDLHSIPGTWRMRLDINGATAIDAPLEVSASPSPTFNRPPAALLSLTLDPPAPAADDVIFCRVNTSLVMDDPDFDLVRYEYVWTVNGTEVRRIVSAGQADAIPTGTAPASSIVRCVVTPSDGRVNGPSSSVQVQIAGGCIADFDDGSGTGTPDGGVGIEDLLYYLEVYGLGVVRADVDDGSGTGRHDGGVGVEDLLFFLVRYDVGC